MRDTRMFQIAEMCLALFEQLFKFENNSQGSNLCEKSETKHICVKRSFFTL